MKIFCDTNIVMEYLQQRQHAASVECILSKALQEGDTLYISSGSFYTITYLTERYLKTDSSLKKEDRTERLRYILRGVLNTFRIADTFGDAFLNAVNDARFDDLEDSYQANVAENMTCEVFLTINEKHFSRFNAESVVRVFSPDEYVKEYV